jgi:hypothetical protein
MDWLKEHETFRHYKKNARPMLTEGNRQKQVDFSKHVHNRWGLLGYGHEDTMDYERREVVVGLSSAYICKTLSKIGCG